MVQSLLFWVFFVLMSFSVNANPFHEWIQQNSKDYAKSLIESGSKANQSQKKNETLSRIKDAKAQKKWSIAIAELELLVGQNPKDMDLWLDLAITAYRAATDSQQKSYEFYDRTEKAAAYVYFNASDKLQQARALLLSAAVTSNTDVQEKCLIELSTLVDLKKLRQDFPDYADLMVFVYKMHNVDRDSNTPQVCFTFSQPLKTTFTPADYFEISPKIDGAFHVRKNQICLTGILFGENYKVTIKEGIPSLFGEKTAQVSKFNFLVDDKSPRLSFPTKTYILQKNDDLLIPLTSVNVKKVEVKVVRVNDRSFIEGFARPYRDLDEEISSYSWKDISNRYGEPVYTGTMEIKGEVNKNITKQIPLDKIVKYILPGAYGIFVKDASTTEEYSSLSASQWVLVTDLGLTVFKGESGLDVHVRSLSSAQPLGQVGLKLMSYNNQVLNIQSTNSDGWAHFDSALLKGKGGNRPAFIFSYGGEGNFASINLSEPAFDLSDRGVEGRKVSGVLDAFPYMERGVYRPGETVRINTILRNPNAMEIGGIPLTFRLIRPDGAIVETQSIIGNAHGFYEVNFLLSSSARTGSWNVLVLADPKAEPIGQAQFSVEDFIPSRLLVTLKSPETLFIIGKELSVDVLGRYLFGAAAAGLEGEASILIRRHPNPFPNLKDYQFGLLDDSFISNHFDLDLPRLDEDGKAKLMTAVSQRLEATVPLQAVIQASVQDRGGRPQLGTLRLDVQNFPYMIGIKGNFKNGVIEFQDKAADLDIITVNTKGEQVAAKDLHYSLYQEEVFYNWSQSDRGRGWEYKPVREDKLLKEGDLSTTADGATKLSLPIEGWGYYRIEVKDANTGAISSFRFTKGHLSKDSQTHSPDKLNIVQDKCSYAVGETVRLHIDAPFDGEALLVIADQEVLETRNIKVSKVGTDVSFKVPNSWGVGAYVLISAFRPLNKIDKDSLQNALIPKRAVGLSWIGLSADPRTLKISMTSPKEMLPRQNFNLPIHVEGNTKSPTFVTVAAVDEGILMLTDFMTPKPQDYFFGKRQLTTEMRDLYGKILDAVPGEMGELRSGGDEGALARNLAALSKRSFRIVSLFQGPVALDGKGNATIPLEIPDFNGTLRLMLVAFNKNSLGSADAQLLVRDPVVSEPVLPRFLSVGDSSQMSFSLFNPSADTRDVNFEMKGTGALELSEQHQTVGLKKDGEWHTKIPIKAKVIGDGAVTFTLSGEGFKPITRTFDMTVRPSTIQTSNKTTWLLQPGETKTLPLKERQSFLPNTTFLTISASDSIPWDTSSIMKSLMTYPYGCVEQTISKGFALLYKKASGKLMAGETSQDIDKALFKTFAILAEKQDTEGGFPLWSVFEANSDAWLTAYAFDYMQQTKELGSPVPEITYDKSGTYLRSFVKSQTSNSSPQKLAAASYALSLLAGQDIIEDGAVRYFFDSYYEKLSHPLSRAYVGLALAKIGDVPRAKRAFEELKPGETVDPTLLPYGSSIRNRAALIKVMIDSLKVMPTLTSLGDMADTEMKILAQQVTPSNPFTTQEQAWLLQAGQTLIIKGQKKGEGASDQIQLAINDQMTSKDKLFSLTLNEKDLSQDVKLSNKGKSPLWVNSVLTGFPKETQKAVAKGINVKKTYYTLSGEEIDVTAKKGLTQGDQFIVVIKGELNEKSSPEVINYMMVVDVLPAGFEIEAGRLGVLVEKNESQSDNNENHSPQYPWDDVTKTLATESRDDRFMAALKLTDDARSFTVAYRVRAVTPGTYVSPGLHVEDMYIPSIYANSAGSTIEIHEKK